MTQLFDAIRVAETRFLDLAFGASPAMRPSSHRSSDKIATIAASPPMLRERKSTGADDRLKPRGKAP